MNPHPTTAVVLGLLIAIVLGAASSPAQAAPGNLIKSTTTFKSNSAMPNLPAKSFSTTQCMPAKTRNFAKAMQHQTGCKTTHLKHHGNHFSYHIACNDGPDHTSGDASFTRNADGSYHGTMHMTNREDGMSPPITSDMTVVGKRIGACDYKPPANQ